MYLLVGVVLLDFHNQLCPLFPAFPEVPLLLVQFELGLLLAQHLCW